MAICIQDITDLQNSDNLVYNNISLDPTTISTGDQSYVNRMRRFLNDSTDLNILTEALVILTPHNNHIFHQM